MTVRLITRPVRRTSRDDYGDPDLDPAALDDEAELRDTFGDSALWLRDHVPAALAAAGVTHTAVNELPWDKFAERLAGTAAPLAQTAARAASDAVSSLGIPASVTPSHLSPGGAWDSSFPLARRAASERAAELVAQVTDEQRQRVADVIQRALAEGWDVPRTSRELRSGIGLTDAWAGAVSNMHAGNLAAGMDPARAGKLADQYYERLLTSRSTTIARTELLDASNQGRLAGWRQAANAGVFDPAAATKRWIVGDSPCPECDGLDGEETEWDGTFSSGDDMPPAHPRCRCTAVIENVEQSGGGEQPAETLGPSEADVAEEPVAAAVSILKAAGLVRKDWTEDAHPRDEHGKFIEGGEAITSSEMKAGQTVTVMMDGSKVTGVVSHTANGGFAFIKTPNGKEHIVTHADTAVLHGAHAEVAKPTTGAGVRVGDKVTITQPEHVQAGQQVVVTSQDAFGLVGKTGAGDTVLIGKDTELTLHEPAGAVGAVAPPVESPASAGPGMVTPPAEGDPFKSFGAGKGVGELPKGQSGVKASSATSRQAVKDHYAGAPIERVAHLDDKRTAVELKDGRVILYRNEGAKGVYASLGSKADMPKPTGVGKLPESQSKIQASSAAGRQALKDYYADPSSHSIEHLTDTTSRITLSDGRVLDLRNENGKLYAKLDKSTLPGIGKPGAAEESTPVKVFSGLGHESAGSLPIGTPVTTLNGQQGIITDHQTGDIKTYVLLTNGSTIETSSSVAMEHGPLGTGKTQTGFDLPPGQQPDGSPAAAGLQDKLNQTAAQGGVAPAGYKVGDGGIIIPDIPSSSKPGSGPITQSAKLSGPESVKAQAALSSPIVANQPLGYASSVVTHENGQSFVYTKLDQGGYKVSAFNPSMVPKPSVYSSHDAAGHAAELYAGFKSPTSNSEGVQWANQHFGSTPKGTSVEIAQAKSYTGSLASTLNNQLRAGSNPTSAKTLDSLLAKNRAPADVVLHRGEPYSKYFTHAQLEKPESLKGRVIHDPGFKSSSVGAHAAFSGNSVQLHMAVPKGTPAAYIQNISHYPNEREVLLGRNLPMRVDDVVHVGNQYHVYLTVLPHDVAMGAAAG